MAERTEARAEIDVHRPEEETRDWHVSAWTRSSERIWNVKRFEFIAVLVAGSLAWAKGLFAKKPRKPKVYTLHIGPKPGPYFRTLDLERGDFVSIYLEGHGIIRRIECDVDRECLRFGVVPIKKIHVKPPGKYKNGELIETFEYKLPPYWFTEGRDFYGQCELSVMVAVQSEANTLWKTDPQVTLEEVKEA
jgi:hypothetical protein